MESLEASFHCIVEKTNCRIDHKSQGCVPTTFKTIGQKVSTVPPCGLDKVNTCLIPLLMTNSTLHCKHVLLYKAA